MDVADNQDNEKAFGRPAASRGSAYPQVRFVSLVENGTHVLFGTRLGGYHEGEITLAHKVLPSLKKGMLCLAIETSSGSISGKGPRHGCRSALESQKESAPAV
jgi:hypothetical protein